MFKLHDLDGVDLIVDRSNDNIVTLHVEDWNTGDFIIVKLDNSNLAKISEVLSKEVVRNEINEFLGK